MLIIKNLAILSDLNEGGKRGHVGGNV